MNPTEADNLSQYLTQTYKGVGVKKSYLDVIKGKTFRANLNRLEIVALIDGLIGKDNEPDGQIQTIQVLSVDGGASFGLDFSYAELGNAATQPMDDFIEALLGPVKKKPSLTSGTMLSKMDMVQYGVSLIKGIEEHATRDNVSQMLNASYVSSALSKYIPAIENIFLKPYLGEPK